MSFHNIHYATFPEAAHDAFRTWIFQTALPFWATSGLDRLQFGFQESLTLDGQPFGAPFKRLRVQARQIYVFSHAAMLGWPDGVRVARRGFDFIRHHGLRDDGSWAKSLGADGGILDATADLYDLAFVILALGWFAKASGSGEALDLAHTTVDWTWRHMSCAGKPGFENTLPPGPGPRLQNPHMHLLEALLALQRVSPRPRLLEQIQELLALFNDRFYDAATGTLGEYFDRDLRPLPGPLGTLVEPGHHYEWVWLLHRCEQATGAALASPIDRLYSFANTHGFDPAIGLVVNAVDRSGAVRDGATRLWPQTEALRAHLTYAVRTGASPDEKVCGAVDALLRRYLCREPLGTWMDAFDTAGTPATPHVPASSLYHLMTSYAALDEYMTEGSV